MKKFLFLIMMSINSLIIIAQSKIATYSSGTFTIDLTSQEREDVLDSIAAVLGHSGCSLDSVVIDDEDPATVDSAAYLVFYGNCNGTVFTFGFYLTKSSKEGQVEYFLNDDENSVNREWACEPTSECSTLACKAKRDHFLGPVTHCKCRGNETMYCEYKINGSGLTWGDIIALLGVLLGLIK